MLHDQRCASAERVNQCGVKTGGVATVFIEFHHSGYGQPQKRELAILRKTAGLSLHRSAELCEALRGVFLEAERLREHDMVFRYAHLNGKLTIGWVYYFAASG